MEKFFQVLDTKIQDVDGNTIVDISTTLKKSWQISEICDGERLHRFTKNKNFFSIKFKCGVDIAEKYTHISLL